MGYNAEGQYCYYCDYVNLMWDAGSSLCVSCPDGRQPDAGWDDRCTLSEADPCAEGEGYFYDGCAPCTDFGRQWDANVQECRPCYQFGLRNNEGTCEACTSGEQLVIDSADPINSFCQTCASLNMGVDGNGACVDCSSLNKYWDGTQCAACPTNTIFFEGQCTQCALAGMDNNNGVCVSCVSMEMVFDETDSICKTCDNYGKVFFEGACVSCADT